MGFLENLNTSQLRAVQQEPSELLIFAGPGSGKTRVLTSRIAALSSWNATSCRPVYVR